MEAFIPDGPVHADDPDYQAALAAEAAFWANPDVYPIADALAAAPLGSFKRHHNRRLTGSETREWYERIAHYGPFRRGLVLGSGSTIEETAILDQNPAVQLTFCDIDGAGLARRQAILDDRYPGRVSIELMDLNLVELEPNVFDLIVSASTLHHVVNLEHLAAEINRALTKDGHFFLHDYTGPSGFRFCDEQKRIFENVYERERLRNPGADLPDTLWQTVDDGSFSPFEAVRSADTVSALEASLDEIERRGTGTILTLAMFSNIARVYKPQRPVRGLRQRVPGWPREKHRIVWEAMLSEQCVHELCTLDDVITDAGLFPPMNTFATYRKKS